MTRHEIETRRERKLQARYVMRDGKRVLEPPEVTAARNAKLNDERMPWPEPEPTLRMRSSLAGLMEEGDR